MVRLLLQKGLSEFLRSNAFFVNFPSLVIVMMSVKKIYDRSSIPYSDKNFCVHQYWYADTGSRTIQRPSQQLHRAHFLGVKEAET
jgi:hypothetical protein